MESGRADAPGLAEALDYLCVDAFLKTLVDARALKTAFELGLVDRLAEDGAASAEALHKSLGLDERGAHLLLGLLRANRVLSVAGGEVRLHADFERALRYRDLLEAKLDFAGATLDDFADLFTLLVTDPRAFMARARLFQLFDYRQALEFSREGYERTKGWMRLTSALTRYEAQARIALHDFSAYRRMLDVGGNSGELVLQVLKRHRELRASVLDLPLVCDVGMEHVLAEPEHARITFYKRDVRNDPLPQGYDLIAFKSMLHDWPEEDAGRYLARAARVLEPGGTLLVFERGPIEIGDAAPAFSMLPVLLFFRSYRPAAVYEERMAALGLTDIRRQEVALDTPFFVVTGRKAA